MSVRSIHSRRGSALLTVLIFSFIIAIVLASQLSLSRGAMRISNRGFYANAALGLAETGLEQGMWALTAALNGNASAWTDWDVSGSDASRKFANFDYGSAASGEVNVHISGYSGDTPQIVAKALITLGDGSGTIEKWLKLSVARSGGGGSGGGEATTPDRSRSIFAYGLLARESIYANGGAWLDSWRSDPDNDPSTPPVPWSNSVARDNARVAVQSTANGALWIDGADVYGTASVGSSNSNGLKMKLWDGQIGPRGTSWSGSYRVAPGALSVDFAATYQTVNEPTGATVRAPYVLPRNVSGPPYYISSESIGTTGGVTVLQMNKLTVEGAATLTIKGDVTIFLPPSGTETVKVAASGKVLLENGAKLTIYTPGNVTVSGAGIANSGAPANVQIWSTRNGAAGTQTISLQGSGALNAVIYAPDADLTLPGHTDFCGAAVVRSARLTGSGAFHYDESLEYFTGTASDPAEEGTTGAGGGGGVDGALAITSFEELNTPADRSPYLATLAF